MLREKGRDCDGFRLAIWNLGHARPSFRLRGIGTILVDLLSSCLDTEMDLGDGDDT